MLSVRLIAFSSLSFMQFIAYAFSLPIAHDDYANIGPSYKVN